LLDCIDELEREIEELNKKNVTPRKSCFMG